MREITIDGKEIRVRATPLALLYYKQEFGSDLLGDLVKMQNIEADMSRIDTVALLQLIWAMAKADKPKGFPGFEKWLAGFESFDLADTEMFVAVMEEAANGFFRGQQKAARSKQPRGDGGH